MVHHRYERNASPLLITLCIRCHVATRGISGVGFRKLYSEGGAHERTAAIAIGFENENGAGVSYPSERATSKAGTITAVNF